MTEKRAGWAMHCHHGIMVEWCYDYDERLDYINEKKPEGELETRRRLFKLLPPEAVAELPERLQRAGNEYNRAWDEYTRAQDEYARAQDEYTRAQDEYTRARAEYTRAVDEYNRAVDAWPVAEREAFHAKWCGCSEWDGKEIVFPPKDKP